MDQHLADGNRVCIVGGGPAGSFAALHLLEQAAKHGLHLEVTIFEPRDFTRPGPTGCNRCAGILSSRLIEGIERLGINLPAELIQADVQSYAVHLQGQTVRIERPSPRHRILSVYRGGGPRVQIRMASARLSIGPAATARGLALKRLAAQATRSVDVVLVEGKQFAGERHYNQCAGVLSPPLPEIMERDLGVAFPHHLTRSKIAGYILHASGQSVTLDDAFEPSTALRRVQFDAYMLEAAVEHGITVVPARAVDIEFHADRVLVYTENAPWQGDVVVGAFGLDAGSAAMFSRVTDYRPPQALSSVVTKYHPGPDGMQGFGTYIHAFLPSDPRIEFGAITPKANHLTINIAGPDADADLMEVFLALPAVRAVLPNLECARQFDGNDLRFFKGYFPCSLAHTYYGDRFVMVGDAAGLVRAFKGKGVTSAVQTGIRAARTILEAGISRQAFDRHFRPANEDILRDLPYGRGMRTLSMMMSRLGLFAPVLRAARQDEHLRTALFDAVSAHAPYSKVIAETLHPAAVTAVVRAMMPMKDE